MKKLQYLPLILLLIFSFTNCENDDVEETTTEIPDTNQNPEPGPITFNYDFGNDVNRNFIGRVVNKNNQPLASATITIGNETTQTDLNGMFVMNNVQVKENFAYIRASLSGYFNGSRSIIPIDGENVIKIMLKERFSVVRETGEEFTLEYDEYSIGFSGDFVKEDGSPYLGSVTIAFNYLSPTDENLNELMPGMLLGQNTDGGANLLETYGMLTVELTGSSNEKLQIASNSELKFPITAEQLSSAPSTIPLWYFDEENGYWIQDGEATKVGGEYVGTVSHFTPWNVDFPIPMTKIDLTVLNQNNAALLGIDINVYVDGETVSRKLTTNNEGKACGFVPANSLINLEITGYCDEVITTLSIGPFAEESTNIIPPIIITDAMIPQSKIQGTLKQCDNSNVTNGYVIMNINNNQPIFYAVTDGEFEFNTFICDGETTFTLQGYDLNNIQSTGENSYTFETPITEVGDLTTCNDVEEFVIYTFVRPYVSSTIERYVDTPFNVRVESNKIYIQKNTGEYFVMQFKPSDGEQFITPGTYEIDSDFIFAHNIPESSGQINWRLNPSASVFVTENQMTIDIIQIGEVGEYIIFTFEGLHSNIYNGFEPWLETVSGTVRVLRDE
ncbi:carboxypeptidase-like regulatory domain-containing protein [Kordia sp.]|uniref:carboxypeptidase-like regulatory domain-containing protein n=1 Tax=Kordia sp. TaxID=1965332 RepID=UPI0025BA0BDF|nr:carboxypeptidase-like regulatory domain-containing protein [Kordia sp.]MCH2196477.1 carboxypeptidase-like regulatory domain-containing protein [Kordia sp.]